MSGLTIERDKGEIRGCVKRRGPVLFGITGELTEFIEQRLMWAKRELGKEVESNYNSYGYIIPLGFAE